MVIRSVMTPTNRTSQGLDSGTVPSEKAVEVTAYTGSMADSGWKLPNYNTVHTIRTQ